MKIEHKIAISNSKSGIIKLLEHLRYGGNIQVMKWEQFTIKYELEHLIESKLGFRITLVYRGSKRFWVSHVKKRAESIGLTVIEV